MSNETSNNEVDSIDLSGNDTKKKPKRRLKDIVLGSFVAAFALCVIFFMAVGIFQTYKEVAEGANGTYAEYSESQSGQDNILGDESSSTDAEDKKEEETSSLPLFKDIVYLEAGNTEIVIEELFNEYKGQNCILKKGITKEESRKSGAQYEIQVMCAGHIYDVKVEIKDTTAPTIDSIEDIYVCIGGTVSYRKYITASDNSDDVCSISIENATVDLNNIGDYEIAYEVSDSSGNTVKVNSFVHVTKNPVINQEYMEPYILEIVNKTINDSMTTKQKAKALYDWCRKNITYLYTSTDRSSVWQGAYDGICEGKGDCFVYYATYEVLLTYAGIENMKVSRVGGETNHWWNLVKIDEGWYHCDSSPRSRGDMYICFMQTDEQIAEYSANNVRTYYYSFDKTLYPERGTEVVYVSRK